MVASSTATSVMEMANAARAGCDTIAVLLRSAAAAMGDQAAAVTSPRDTTAFLRDSTEAACVVDWRDSTAHELSLDDLYRRLERSGWRQREQLLNASGPGSEAMAFSRGAAACVVSTESDVPDDDDSTRSLVPGFAVSATCFPDRPDPPPVVDRFVRSPHVPIYSSPSSPLGAGCGADRTGVPDSLSSVVEIFIDSVSDNGLNELQSTVSLPPKSNAGVASMLTARVVYSRPGQPAPLQEITGCPWSGGETLRLNTSRISRAALNVDATGPVRIEVRSVDGTLISTPILTQPGSGPHTIRWTSPRDAP